MKQREWQDDIFSKKLDERSWTDGTKNRDSFGWEVWQRRYTRMLTTYGICVLKKKYTRYKRIHRHIVYCTKMYVCTVVIYLHLHKAYRHQNISGTRFCHMVKRLKASNKKHRA
jgi:hypothetical protein